jgi:hypothetical protein
MSTYTVYNTSTGVITHSGSCQTGDESLQAGAGETVDVTGNYSDVAYHYVNGVLTAYSVPLIAAIKAGPPAVGYTWNPLTGWVDHRPLAIAQTQAGQRMLTQRDALEYANFTCAGVTYTASADDQRRIAAAVQLAIIAAQQPFSIVLDDVNNVAVPLNAAGVIAVGAALAASVATAFSRFRTAITAIKAASTNAQADAITL